MDTDPSSPAPFCGTSARAYSVRPVAADRDAVAEASVGVVVPHRAVLGAAVVPEGDRVGLPLEAHRELGRLDVAPEHLQDRIALAFAEADNAGREHPIYEQDLPARDRVGAHDRVLGTRIRLAGIGRVAL